MKRKVFFIISSLSAGGAQRVFWLVSQYFNHSLFDVSIVLLDSTRSFFSHEIEGVTIIDLKTKKASLSFFKLYNLIKAEKPYAVFSTGGHIDTLVSFTSLFVKIPLIIARPTNVTDKERFSNAKSKFLGKISSKFYQHFDVIVCQSDEIRNSYYKKCKIDWEKLVIIPNPVIETKFLRTIVSDNQKIRLIVVARLTEQKGLRRLINIMKDLPSNYHLTIAGDGPLRSEILEQIELLRIQDRVQTLGTVNNVIDLIAEHNLFVLPSFIEGFPNVVIESLSVGTPVVSFEVGGINEIIQNDFNGFIVEQGNIDSMKAHIIQACFKKWDSCAIQEDVKARFGIKKVVGYYEKLIA